MKVNAILTDGREGPQIYDLMPYGTFTKFKIQASALGGTALICLSGADVKKIKRAEPPPIVINPPQAHEGLKPLPESGILTVASSDVLDNYRRAMVRLPDGFKLSSNYVFWFIDANGNEIISQMPYKNHAAVFDGFMHEMSSTVGDYYRANPSAPVRMAWRPDPNTDPKEWPDYELKPELTLDQRYRVTYSTSLGSYAMVADGSVRIGRDIVVFDANGNAHVFKVVSNQNNVYKLTPYDNTQEMALRSATEALYTVNYGVSQPPMPL